MKSIAVVIPMYNSEATIVDVLDGIQNQTFVRNVRQVILVDDGSKDKSTVIVKQYASHSSMPIILVEKENGGVASARNRGMSEVKDAEWVAFCDSDDVWLPNKLERLFECIDENNDIDCIGSAFSERPLRIGFNVIDKLHRGTVKEICISNFPQPSTVMMKKRIYDEMGGFDENQRYAEDGNFFLRVAANYNLYYLPEKLIIYGYGKRGFGEKGLSANLKGMYDGNVKNMKDIRALGYISYPFYCQMRLYYWIKYIRRIILTNLTKKHKK